MIWMAVVSLLNSCASVQHTDSEAWVKCKEFVVARLNAPSTADFPFPSSQYLTTLGEGKYRVRAYVDAENAFGGTVRMNYDCTTQWQPDDRWTLERLDLEP